MVKKNVPMLPFGGKESCMLGLISILDFRRGSSTSRALLDKKHSSGRHSRNANPESQFTVMDVQEKGKCANTTVRALIEKEMCRAQNSSRQAVVRPEKKVRDKGVLTSRYVDARSKPAESLPPVLSNSPDVFERSPFVDPLLHAKNFRGVHPSKEKNNKWTVEVAFCGSSETHLHGKEHKNLVLQKARIIALEPIASDKSFNANDAINEILELTEPVNGGELISTNRDVSPTEPVNRDELASTNRSLDMDDADRLGTSCIQRGSASSIRDVPSQLQLHGFLQNQGGKRRVSSYFSLRKIGKTLKHVLDECTELRHWTSILGVMPPFNNNHALDGIRGNSDGNSIVKFVVEDKFKEVRRDLKPGSINRDVGVRPNGGRSGTLADCLHREDALRREAKGHISGDVVLRRAKGHIAKALSRTIENRRSPTSVIQKTLADVMFLKDYAVSSSNGTMELQALERRCSTTTPESDEESFYSCMKQSCLRQDSSFAYNKPKTELGQEHSIRGHSGKLMPDIFKISNSKGELKPAYDSMGSHLVVTDAFHTDSSSEGGLSSPSDLGSVSTEEQPEFSFAAPTLYIRKIYIPDTFFDRVEPSPVSVLEGAFVDDLISPHDREAELGCATPSAQSSVFLLRNLHQPNLEAFSSESEEKIEYEGQPNSSLLHRILGSTRGLLDNPKLLSDVANEVLGEVQERHLACMPWIRLVAPTAKPIPSTRQLEREVCGRIHEHLNAHLATTMDELVEMHLNSESWVDLYFYMESSLLETGDDILIDLLEECIGETVGSSSRRSNDSPHRSAVLDLFAVPFS